MIWGESDCFPSSPFFIALMSPSYSHTFASTNVDRMVPFSFKNDAPAEGIVEAMEQVGELTNC